MANQTLFGSNKGRHQKVREADIVNAAGGRAYKRSDEQALAQFAATGMFKNTFYTDAQSQMDEVLQLAKRVDPIFLAKVAVYSRQKAYLKDMPALLLAVLLTRDTELFRATFPLIIDNGRMVRNFVQIMRSGVVGRTSLGSAAKKAVQRWLERSSDDYLFKASVGNNPSIGDVIRLVHPAPGTVARDNLYAYLSGFPEKKDATKKQLKAGHFWMRSKLPRLVAAFERFKRADAGDRKMPDLPFQLLDSAGLSKEEWAQIARDGKWMFTRMNLNTFQRKGLYEDRKLVKLIAERLSNKELVQKARQYPYQIYTAHKATQASDLPAAIVDGLHDALDHSLGNVPEFEGRTAILVDVSASMGWAMNRAERGSYRTKATVSCREIAALFASAVLRANRDAVVYAFDTNATRVRLNARDTVFTNAAQIGRIYGGGTNMSAGLQKLMSDFKGKSLPDNVVIVSDNESWADAYGYGWKGTGSMHQWAEYKKRNPKARLVLIDITPSSNTQLEDRDDILNVGGFSDAVFDVIAGFTKSRGQKAFWAQKIRNEISLG